VFAKKIQRRRKKGGLQIAGMQFLVEIEKWGSYKFNNEAL
jgi:hypothetical protein